MNDAGYLRFPSIQGETIVLVAEDDIWSVSVEGGPARRLTANLGEVSHPALSPDASLIAFTSREEHHPEVYCMPSAGGPARRVTWLGATSHVRGWTPRGEILFASDAQTPFRHLIHLRAVAPAGGPTRRLPFGPAREAAFGPRGAVVLGRNTADPARWKRYRGGTAGELWIDPRGTGSFRRLLALPGNLASPMWLGARVFFLSDHEGVGNLYSCRPDGEGLRRHSDHGEYYARFAKTDGARIAYQHAAEVWVYDPDGDTTRRVEVSLNSPRVQRNRRFVPAERYLADYALHPGGHTVAIHSRGKLFTMALFERAVRQHGRTDGVRYKLARWIGDGSSLVVVSDEGGDDAIEVHQPDEPSAAPRRLDGLDLGCVTDLATPPRGTRVAVANQRHELHLVDLDAATSRLLDRSRHGGLSDVVWSPDGRFLAYSFAASVKTRSIRLCEVETGECHPLTDPEFRDLRPSFDPDGRYLYFLSYRVFDPVYDSHFFDLGFPRGMRPHLITLRADEPSPFLARPKGFGPEEPKTGPGASTAGASTAGASTAGASTAGASTPGASTAEDQGEDKADGPQTDEAGTRADPGPVLQIDLAGIRQRVIPFPLPEGRYAQVVGIKGKVLLTSFPVQGSLERNTFEPRSPQGTLEVYDLAESRHEVLAGGVSGFEVSRDGHTLVYRADRKLRALRAGDKPSETTDPDPTGRRAGWLDLGRIRVSVDPGAEWRQMLQEAWRLQRDHFWVEDMSGVDWDRVLARYLPLVDKVASRLEFSDLMWEMQGELGTSHAYELGGDHRPAPSYAMGHLGAEIAYDDEAGAWRIVSIVEGDSWDPGASSPLRGPGVDVSAGDLLLGVNGRATTRSEGPASLLVNQAGTMVELGVARSDGSERRNVVVTTLRDERPARYREWVIRNRARVHEESGGRVGYVHVPDMGPGGYAEFHRSYLHEVEREALVVDVRFNGGGHVSQLVLEKLARRRIGYDVSRWGSPDPYPNDSPGGPLVAVTNEHAGSDGDIFTHSFKLLGLGPVIGKRTWGGVIGISPSHVLVDGSVTTQPEYAFWFSDIGWGLENYGADPDVEVDIRPQDHAAGRDPQLKRAISLALGALRRHRPPRPDLSNRPRLALPVLPAQNGERRGGKAPGG